MPATAIISYFYETFKSAFTLALKLEKRFAVLFTGLICILCISSCVHNDLFEKSAPIPQHAWQSSYKPAFEFNISDSTSNYKLFLVLRHTEKYNFNNIFVNLYIKGPGQDTAQKIQRDLVLGTNEKGWLGTGMDDIYEHRVLLAEQRLKAGVYRFTLEQIMREDPLLNVLNAGIRVERSNP